MNSRLSFALALCMGVLVFSHADADHHKNKNKGHCEKIFECDYFAPNTSCSTPPCCKKGHWECANDGGNTANAPETPKETPKAEPSKQYCEGYGNMNGVEYFKANCSGQHSGKFDCSVDNQNPLHYHCCCYY